MNKIKLMDKLSKIPNNAEVESDSGWECDSTSIDRVFYNSKTNTVVFTQIDGNKYDERYMENDGWAEV